MIKQQFLQAPSGVGKSSFTNILLESDTMETGGISRTKRKTYYKAFRDI